MTHHPGEMHPDERYPNTGLELSPKERVLITIAEQLTRIADSLCCTAVPTQACREATSCGLWVERLARLHDLLHTMRDAGRVTWDGTGWLLVK